MFKPGEEALYWYAVVSGTLKMFNVDPKDPSKVHVRSQSSLPEARSVLDVYLVGHFDMPVEGWGLIW